jgi:membrane protease YdiL (CAAX protease family)
MNGEASEAEILPLPQETPESRKLRWCELALVVSVGYLSSTLYSLYDWWTETEAPPFDEISSLVMLFQDLLAISVLAYVLHRQGRSLRTIGFTTRFSDLPWALLLLFFSWLLSDAVISVLFNFRVLPDQGVGVFGPGVLSWLMILPAAAAEELIVRAFLMTEVAELTGRMWIALLASVGFQTLYHLYQGTPSALISAGMFLVSALFYASTRRITPVILAHALYNVWILVTQGP